MDDQLFVGYLCDDSCDKGSDHTGEGNIIEDNKIYAMRKFNAEDYELVKSYERDFKRAIESRYCTGLLTEELEVISRIYRETLNRQANLSCGGCVLQMMTSVGRLYFAYVKTRPQEEEPIKKENKEEEKNETETESKTGEGVLDALSDNC